ncbi:uncharacterized protein V6R79_013229 [Siganus canaliculatus]
MRNPRPLNNAWNRSISKEPTGITVTNTNKKFKRKSQEPKRVLCEPEPERMRNCPVDTSDEDSMDDMQTESSNVSRLAPLHSQLVMSREEMATAAGALSESSMLPVQSGAIDMRIGTNGSAMISKLSQLPPSPFSNTDISQWHPAISQPLSSRLKLDLCSIFPPPTSSSGGHSLPASQQAFSLDSTLSGQPAFLPVPHNSQRGQCHKHMERQVHSPKESPRKRPGVSEDGAGRLPEVKAIQQTRRLLANARERTRVHTISAAFEALRKQVPCYSYGQKLSKLAILRIACNYILSLAQLAELDYSSDHNSVSFSQCVEQCTRTLQAEGRSKKRKR